MADRTLAFEFLLSNITFFVAGSDSNAIDSHHCRGGKKNANGS